MKKTTVFVIIILVLLALCIPSIISAVREHYTIKNIQAAKSSPEQLVRLLLELEEKYYLNPNIQEEVLKLDLSLEEKIEIKSEKLNYYHITITKQEVEDYVNHNGSNPLYTESNKGGYYDGEKNITDKKTIGLKDSPLYDEKSIIYFGDFFELRERGVRLNDRYQEEPYSNSSFYFKDKKIEFNPKNYDCYYSGKYLFAIGKEKIYIYDTELERTFEF